MDSHLVNIMQSIALVALSIAVILLRVRVARLERDRRATRR